jgi:hypothetical protein
MELSEVQEGIREAETAAKVFIKTLLFHQKPNFPF